MEIKTSSIGIRSFAPLLIIFLLTTALFISAPGLLASWRIDAQVLTVGNLILFAATAVSFYFYWRSLQHNNANVFMRMIYAGTLLKILLCLITSVIYISAAGKNVNKGAIFGCMFLYLLYTFTEVAILMKIGKQQKNG